MTQVFIERLELIEVAGRKELRIDWSNDRHHSVVVEFGDPEGILLMLDRAAYLIRADIKAGKLQ